MAARTAYDLLKERFAQISHLGHAASILNVDAQVAMAAGSAADRTGQVIAIASASHMLITAPDVAQWLDAAEKDKASLPADDQRNLELMRRNWVHANALSKELAEEVARIESEGEHLHVEHKKNGDWAKMRDWYKHSFDTARAIGTAKMAKLGVATPYEALLDSFSPGLTSARIDAEFAKLQAHLPAIIREAVARQQALPAPLPLKSYPVEQQVELCRTLALAMGFDTNRGVISVIDGHPSCNGSPDDIRFTLGCTPENFLEAVYSTIHEAGHGIYDQNRPAAWRYQPAGEHLGMNVHESQSRIMEVQACHTPAFFRFLEQAARKAFNEPTEPSLSAANLERLINTAQPSFIRTEADEVTYAVHVMLRYRIEKAMVNGDMTIDELPKAWNDGLKDMLGITPPHAGQGHMQDVHWPCGLVGYFPAYTLGDMGAAQLYAAATKARPDITAELEKGNFTPLRTWLNDNVHGKGSLLPSDEMFRQATGEALNADYLLNHLSQRYLGRPFVAAAAAAPDNKHKFG